MQRIIRTLLIFVLLAVAGFAADDFAETKKEADAGDAAAQYDLGVMYHDGDGVPMQSCRKGSNISCVLCSL